MSLRPFGALPGYSPPSGPPDPSREEAMSDHIRKLEEQIETLHVAADEVQGKLADAMNALNSPSPRNTARLHISAAAAKLEKAFEKL